MLAEAETDQALAAIIPNVHTRVCDVKLGAAQFMYGTTQEQRVVSASESICTTSWIKRAKELSLHYDTAMHETATSYDLLQYNKQKIRRVEEFRILLVSFCK